jgi:hypothetical protein
MAVSIAGTKLVLIAQHFLNQYLYNKEFSKSQISDYISAILGSRAPKFARMIDYLMDLVNN